MNKKTKQEYLNNPTHCPICQSTNVTPNQVQVQNDGKNACMGVICDRCGSMWQDVYDLTDVKILYTSIFENSENDKP